MPAGKPMGYIGKKIGAFGSTVRGAVKGKSMSQVVAAGAPPARSTMARAKDNRVAKYVMAHPYKSAGIGMGAMGAASYASGRTRRGPGTSKVSGRPTGPYQY